MGTECYLLFENTVVSILFVWIFVVK